MFPKRQKTHVLKNDNKSKGLNIVKAMAGGAAVGFLDKTANNMSWYANMNDHLKNVIPAGLAFLAADFDAPFAMGMAGVAGYKEGKTLGIFNTDDMIDDIFDEEIKDIEINDSDDDIDDIDDIEINGSDDDIDDIEDSIDDIDDYI